MLKYLVYSFLVLHASLGMPMSSRSRTNPPNNRPTTPPPLVVPLQYSCQELDSSISSLRAPFSWHASRIRRDFGPPRSNLGHRSLNAPLYNLGQPSTTDRYPVTHISNITKRASRPAAPSRHPVTVQRILQHCVSDWTVAVYLGSHSLGTLQGPFKSLFDTGSSNLLVVRPDAVISTGEGLGNTVPVPLTIRRWDPHNNPAIDPAKQLHYGVGTVTTSHHKERIRFSGQEKPTTMLDLYAGYIYPKIAPTRMPDAIFGTAPNDQTSLIWQTINSMGFSARFSLNLFKADGKLIIGGGDPSVQYKWVPLINLVPGFLEWAIKLDNLFVDGVVIPGAQGVGVLVDTGSSMIIGPQGEIKNAYLKLVTSPSEIIETQTPSFTNFMIPCTKLAGSQLFQFVFGNVMLTLAQEYHVSRRSAEHQGYCEGPLVGLRETYSPQWVIGSTLLQDHFVSFDLEKQRMGFADPPSQASDAQQARGHDRQSGSGGGDPGGSSHPGAGGSRGSTRAHAVGVEWASYRGQGVRPSSHSQHNPSGSAARRS